MSRRKKLVLVLAAALLVAGGVLGGTAAALADDEAAPQENTLLEKVAEIYETNTGTPLDTEQLQAAFQQAREELRVERRNAMLDRLVEEGTITQEEADEFKDWLDAMPDIDLGTQFNVGEMPFRQMHRPFSGMRGFHPIFDCPVNSTD